MIKVIDNFLPKKYVDDIEKLFLKPKEHTTSEIAWFYNDYTASKDKDYLDRIKNNKHFFDSFQFTHRRTWRCYWYEPNEEAFV